MIIEPAMRPDQYKTYQMLAPQRTHRRKATCAEVSCPAYANGFKMGFDLSDPDRAKAAKWIRLHSGRKFTVDESVPGKVILTFPSGQSCFQTHTISIEREPFYIVRGGDARATIGELLKRTPDHWVDDFANHQDRLHTAHERG